MQAAQQGDTRWLDGLTWSLQYHVDEAHLDLLKQAFDLYFSNNYINPFLFKSLMNMEKEVVGMAANLLNGNKNTVGTVTSGGTESILLALYACREWAKKHRPGIRVPEVVAPRTIHPAFDKAAHYFGLKLKKAPVGTDMEADVEALRRLISKNTVLLAASAPSFANGVLDPIPAIGQLAQEHRLFFHVDACVGGFMLPWVERLGRKLDPWDFRVPGVTSISVDLHKFGFGAKGASVLLHRDSQLFEYQLFVNTEYAGGIFATATILGSRPGGPIAAAWAGLRYLGEAGFLENARAMLAATDAMMAGLSAIPELEIIGKPCMNMFSFRTRSDRPDIYVVADQLEKQGWVVDRQQLPNSIHLTVFPYNIPVAGRYVDDVRQAVDWAKQHPEASGEGNAALYGLMARLPMRGMVEQNVRKVFLDAYTGGQAAETPQHEAPGPSLMLGRLNRFLGFWQRVLKKS